MNEAPQPHQPVWTSAALVAVLAAQVGLLWLHGGLLNRQHGEIQAMRQDIQDLTEALDNHALDQDPSTEEDNFQPASHRPHRRHRHPRRRHLQPASHVAIVLQESQEKAQEEEEPGRKEIEAARDSAKKAVDQSYKAQRQLSISENIRKADEQKKIEAAKSSFLPIVYGAMALALVAFIAGRMWRARSGGR